MGMPVGDYLAITEELRQARFSDAAPVLVRQRMFKTPDPEKTQRPLGESGCGWQSDTGGGRELGIE